MRRALVVVVAVVVALACACEPRRSIDPERSAALFRRETVDTRGIHGLSGLAIAPDQALWAVAERGKTAFRIELERGRVKRTDGVPVEGLPPGNDMESAAFGPGGDLYVGTENNAAGVASVFRLRRDGDRFRVLGEPITITRADAGIDVGANHGAEALCAADDWLVVALETAGTDAGGRWAPLVMIQVSTGTKLGHRLRLRTATGKISGLDCWSSGGHLRAVAIERHFEVTQLVAFDLPPGDAPSGDIATSLVVDLAPALRGALNLEGIVRTVSGRLVAVVDNQYKTITGPDELLLFTVDLALAP